MIANQGLQNSCYKIYAVVFKESDLIKTRTFCFTVGRNTKGRCLSTASYRTTRHSSRAPAIRVLEETPKKSPSRDYPYLRSNVATIQRTALEDVFEDVSLLSRSQQISLPSTFQRHEASPCFSLRKKSRKRMSRRSRTQMTHYSKKINPKLVAKCLQLSIYSKARRYSMTNAIPCKLAFADCLSIFMVVVESGFPF